MPQPGGAGANPYNLPYPAASTGNMPYPQGNFGGGFPSYPGTSGATNPQNTGYPPYMPSSSNRGFYGGVSIQTKKIEEDKKL